MPEQHGAHRALGAGGLAPILASTCCPGPLVLISLGFSGAWIGNLTAFEPYRAFFIGAALIALFVAYRRSIETLTRATRDAGYPATVKE